MMHLFPNKIKFKKRSRAKKIKFIHFIRSISIENWLRYSLIALVIGNLTIVSTISIKLSRDAQQQRTQELQEERALALAREVRTHLDDLQQQLNYLQKVRGLAVLPNDVRRILLEGLTRENDAYEMVAIVNKSGKILTAIAPYSTEDAAKIALETIQKTGLATAVHQQIYYIHPVQLNPELKVPVTTIVLPIQDKDGRSQGVLVATINLKFLNYIVAQSQIGKTGYVYILDNRNRIIAKKRTKVEAYQEIRLESINNKNLIESLDKNLPNSIDIYPGLRGVNVLGTSSFVYGVNWHVVVELPLREVYAPVRRLLLLMVIILIITSIISVFLSIKIAGLLVSPLESLTQAANRISQGDFSGQVKLKTRNELGVLSSAFNYMISQIRNSFKTLEDKNNELSKTLEKLKQAQLQLVQNEKMSSLGLLVAGIAHEINNPINFIHGNILHTEDYTDSLLQLIALYQQYYPQPNIEIQEEIEEVYLEFIRQDLPKLIQSMKMGSQRVQNIVNSLRNFSRLDEASLKEVDIHKGINNTLIILQNHLKAKSNSCEIRILKKYGQLPLISCYPAQLNQVFMNLINNAIDALSPLRQKDSERQAEITITTEYKNSQTDSQSKNTEILISIADNGEGIPDEIKKHIFDPFFTTKPIGKGTGLGLSISYQIITETHQGTLDCFSTVGKGSEFQIKIPCQISS